MTHDEIFADPVVVPGPNPRSLFVDTEEVEDAVTGEVDKDTSRLCPSCHRVFPSTELVCPNDAASLVMLPSATDLTPPT